MNAPVKPLSGAEDVVVLRPVLYARQVADMLGWTERHFLERRDALEREQGFPGRLPGLNRYSRAAVLRWIETNGRTWQPRADEAVTVSGGALELSIQALEEEYRQ